MNSKFVMRKGLAPIFIATKPCGYWRSGRDTPPIPKRPSNFAVLRHLPLSRASNQARRTFHPIAALNATDCGD